MKRGFVGTGRHSKEKIYLAGGVVFDICGKESAKANSEICANCGRPYGYHAGNRCPSKNEYNAERKQYGTK